MCEGCLRRGGVGGDVRVTAVGEEVEGGDGDVAGENEEEKGCADRGEGLGCDVAAEFDDGDNCVEHPGEDEEADGTDDVSEWHRPELEAEDAVHEEA